MLFNIFKTHAILEWRTDLGSRGKLITIFTVLSSIFLSGRNSLSELNDSSILIQDTLKPFQSRKSLRNLFKTAFMQLFKTLTCLIVVRNFQDLYKIRGSLQDCRTLLNLLKTFKTLPSAVFLRLLENLFKTLKIRMKFLAEAYKTVKLCQPC